MSSSNDTGAVERKPVRVTIFNQTYTLVTGGDPADIEELGRTVDEIMTNIAARGGNLDVSRIAVLSCLHLADELRIAQRELDSLKHRTVTKHREFQMLLEKAVDG
jgi:cell division protein ZapA